MAHATVKLSIDIDGTRRNIEPDKKADEKNELASNTDVTLNMLFVAPGIGRQFSS